jgi:hypothetical protein
MLNSIRKRYRRSRSVNEYDLEHNNSGDSHKSKFSMFNLKSNGHRVTTGVYSLQHVHSEPTRRKFGPELQLNRSKSNSTRSKGRYGTIFNADSNRSVRTPDFVSSREMSDDESVSRFERGSVSSPSTPRRLAICTELEKETYMKNGESLLMSHKNLVVRDYLQSCAYI